MDAIDQTVAAVLKGDDDRYREVVGEYEGMVRAVVAAMVPDPNLVPDLAQEVFIIAYKRLSTYQVGTNFSAWLRTIARNVAQNERRRWYRRHQLEERFRTEVGQCIESHVDRALEEMPEDLIKALKDCVTRLPGKTREVMDGFYYQERPIQEVAGRLLITATSAKVILHRARQAIGSCLQKKGSCRV